MDDRKIEHRGSEAWDKTKGKTNEVVGAATGDRSQEFKGKAQTAKGNVKGAVNDMRDER